MPNFISEDQIEQALIQRLQHQLGYDVLNCHTDDPDDLNDGSGRADKREVVFVDRLRNAALRLNSGVPESAIDDALSKLLEKRQAMTEVAANREIDTLIRDGIPIQFENKEGRTQDERIRVIDFQNPENNEFLAVSQLWVKGERGYRRPDVLLYVNGFPLVFIELKNSNVKLKSAYESNVAAYRSEIPQLYLTNAFCVLSNGLQTRVGSITAEWEHFFTWLRVDNEKEKVNRETLEQKGETLARVIDGLFPKARLLDYVEHFIFYYNENQKIIGQNHQFIGVNKAYDAFLNRKEKQGKLGVFWHTQGSGKSFSMIFLVRKIFRTITGNFTFVVVTDREDLDGQIYRNFLNTETVKKSDTAEPKDSEEMRKFLGQNKRLVFTLIQKFGWPKGKEYPLLSKRDDIVVIVDEAHRTQYKTLAENMRHGLPHAQYLAFTGTPLLGRDRKTNAWFGDYVSEYNFQQSMHDGATVPLFYQKRVPEVLIQNEDLSDEFYQILEDENLDDARKEKLEKKFSTELEVIKRDDRLETIAKDIVYHFPRRGFLGKGIVISVDKFTAVKMYDKVQRLWKEQLRELQGRIRKSASEIEKERLKKRLDYMRRVEMAVVVSEEAGEEEKFKKQGLDIKPHRDRMNRIDEHGHDIEYNFKDPQHPLQLVFVCAMWLTGFDAPTVSTLYLDKPQKDHTLMQSIARANRVTSFKVNGVEKKTGEIVDYYNVFRSMKKALKDYAQGAEGADEPPVREKSELFVLLDDAIKQAADFCGSVGVRIDKLLKTTDVFKNVEQFKQYADILLTKDDWRKAFAVYENTLSGLYEASKPEILKKPDVVRTIAVFQYLRGVIDAVIEQTDIEAVGRRVGELLDESVVVAKESNDLARGYGILKRGKKWDLSRIDFEELKRDFKGAAYRNIEIADLRAFIQRKLEQMLKQNRTRAEFAQRLQEIIDQYNAGGTSNENYFDELLKFTKELKAEDERHTREGLTEDELELFDLLKKDKMTKEETQKVKLAAKALLHRLREEAPPVLVQDWFKDGQTRKVVRSAVEGVLDAQLPSSYDRVLFRKKCDDVLEMMLDYASHGLKWAA
jgi:type I restriction enzyme, R subunit